MLSTTWLTTLRFIGLSSSFKPLSNLQACKQFSSQSSSEMNFFSSSAAAPSRSVGRSADALDRRQLPVVRRLFLPQKSNLLLGARAQAVVLDSHFAGCRTRKERFGPKHNIGPLASDNPILAAYGRSQRLVSRPAAARKCVLLRKARAACRPRREMLTRVLRWCTTPHK
jgi:hypothetical protein